MSTTIDAAFIKQFEREVHEAYQRINSAVGTALILHIKNSKMLMRVISISKRVFALPAVP